MKKISEFLQRTEDGKGNPSSFGVRVVKVIAAIIAIAILIVFLQIFAIFGIFNWAETQVRLLTGLDMYLVKGICFFLLALLFGTPLISFVWSFLPIPQKNKKRKRFILLSVLAIFFFAVYFSSKNVYFNPESGKPTKYYSLGPNGEYNFYSSGGYDPVTGDKLQKVDKETVLQYLNGSSVPKNIEFNSVNESILTGAEKDSHFYSVKFKNEIERNIYLCVSFRNNYGEPIIIQKIPVGESRNLKLMEGGHYFSYMDNNGNCYGKRIGGKILTQVDGKLSVAINNQRYDMYRVFCLDVIASDKEVITLKEELVSHNHDLNNDEKDKLSETIALAILSLFVLVFLTSPVWILKAAKITKKKKPNI
jgi:hypothetical protein